MQQFTREYFRNCCAERSPPYPRPRTSRTGSSSEPAYRKFGAVGCYIDLDGHFGNSIEDSRKFQPDLNAAVPVGFNFNSRLQGEAYYKDLTNFVLKRLTPAIINGEIDYVVWCHGADSHEWDQLGLDVYYETDVKPAPKRDYFNTHRDFYVGRTEGTTTDRTLYLPSTDRGARLSDQAMLEIRRKEWELDRDRQNEEEFEKYYALRQKLNGKSE